MSLNIYPEAAKVDPDGFLFLFAFQGQDEEYERGRLVTFMF